VTTSLRPMLCRFWNSAEYEDDLFINSEEAKEIITKDALLVIVDVNRPSYTECPELAEIVENCVIIDHHRLTGEIAPNAVLSYIEPYASSACEMVAEILQYSGDEVKLKQVEADAMYAGMMVDTNNFLSKTGVRTFEAAAFLRRNGADVTRIRKMFRTEFNEYQIRAKIVSEAEVYNGCFAFGKLEANVDSESPTVLAAQIANELMEIANIKASFVFSYYNNKVYVSARSIDEYNVQVLMEKFGGGGHMSSSGCQFTDITIDEAIEKVKGALDEKEGEI
ncbi:MAG: DHH family phosphoesterase, partial [Lachnospiraceae bacterium]|nr:DHH family phosphoesterase [Lachnospiraceae bacterium]